MGGNANIGNVTSGYRTIMGGGKYDKYFPRPDYRDRVIIRDGEVGETVALMQKVALKYLGDTEKIAQALKGKSLRQTCENTWGFLYRHIQYKLDKQGEEQLRRPARSWAERREGIDCDCFTIFASGILANLGVPHSYRITKYNKAEFQHVYAIVPTPGGKGHYAIDCVVSQFDYEKPYTEKKDYPMDINGINIAVLSGPGLADALSLAGLLEGPGGLGADTEAGRAQAVYEHLVATRNLVAQKPHLIEQIDYPPAFLQMLDYAIGHWHTPNRGKALDVLARNEDTLNRLNGMEGIQDYTDLDGADDDWAHLEGLSLTETMDELNGKTRAKPKAKAPAAIPQRKPVAPVRRAAPSARAKWQAPPAPKQAARLLPAPKAPPQAAPKKAKKGFFKKAGAAIKQGAKAIVRFNPVTISARSGFLLALKLNLKKMASKLKWGYATKEQAAAKGVTAQEWQKSKNALAKVEKLFADKLQGQRSSLQNAILKGKAGGLAGMGEEISIGSLGVAPAAAMATAVPVIAAALKILVDSGLMDKKEAEGIESEVAAKASAAEELVAQSPASTSAPESSGAPEANTSKASAAAAPTSTNIDTNEGSDASGEGPGSNEGGESGGNGDESTSNGGAQTNDGSQAEATSQSQESQAGDTTGGSTATGKPPAGASSASWKNSH